MNNNLSKGGSYVSPSLKICRMQAHQRVLCVSTGNLDQGDFGSAGFAGGGVEESNGGSLF